MFETVWTEEMDKVIIKKYKKISVKEIAIKLNKAESSVRNRISVLKKKGKINSKITKGSRWNEKEDEFLLNNYGHLPIEELSKKLKRSNNAINSRLRMLVGSESVTELTDMYSTSLISEIVGVNTSTVNTWIRNNGLTTVKSKGRICLVEQETFWDWLKNNTHRVKIDKVNTDLSYIFPKWYKEELERLKGVPDKVKYWTPYEETTAYHLFIKGYTYDEIANELNRTRKSVSRKMVRIVKSKMIV